MPETTDEEQPSELYDFLYRDAERIASYYAQIWNGRLLSVEETKSEAEKQENTIKGDAKLLSTESKIISDYQFQNKRTVDMHDASTVDLLIRLTAQRAEKGFGSIQVLSGTCFFLDRNILKYAGPAIDMIVAQMKQTSSPRTSSKQTKWKQQAQSDEKMYEVIKKMFSTLEMPSGFVLKINDELSLCGPVKEAGLDQPISSLLFRAGNLGLANTYVVGLVEELGIAAVDAVSLMHQYQQQLATAFFPVLFPENALRVIPLAIYRKIPISKA